MFKRTLLAAAMVLLGVSWAQTPSTPAPAEKQAEPAFEMATYYMAFLYRGPKWTPERTPETEKIQEAHMANIRKMGEEGKLLLAGPFLDEGELRGIFIFKVASLEEAKALAESDPAVMAGRLRIEIHPWFAAKNIVVTARAPK